MGILKNMIPLNDIFDEIITMKICQLEAIYIPHAIENNSIFFLFNKKSTIFRYDNT